MYLFTLKKIHEKFSPAKFFAKIYQNFRTFAKIEFNVKTRCYLEKSKHLQNNLLPKNRLSNIKFIETIPIRYWFR